MIAVHLRGAYLDAARAIAGNVRRAARGAVLNISSLSAKSAFGWGSPQCRGKGGHAGTDARLCRRSCPQRRARERDLPGPGHGNQNVEGFRPNAGGTPGCFEGGPAQRFREYDLLQGRGQTANEIADAALFLCSGTGQRHYGAVAERGRWSSFLLISSAATNARLARCPAALSPFTPGSPD